MDRSTGASSMESNRTVDARHEREPRINRQSEFFRVSGNEMMKMDGCDELLGDGIGIIVF